MSYVKKLDSPNAIIDRLEDLRNRHRLALHVWEQDEQFMFPSFSYRWMSHVTAEEIPVHLRNNTMPLMSMSLVPSQHKSMKPFEIKENKLPMLGYLVDLDQHQTHPPKVLKAKPLNINSGFVPLQKRLLLDDPSEVEGLRKIYMDFYFLPDQQWRDTVASEHQGGYTKKQLDALGMHAHGKTANIVYVDNILPHNEILVASAKEHINAIVAPIYISDNLSEATKREYMCLLKLSGALAGLEHIEKGVDVPVAYYHVSPAGPSETTQQGTFSYLGKGKTELTEKAIEAIRELNAMQLFEANSFKSITASKFYNLDESVSVLLGGIELSRPLSEQISTLKALESKYKSHPAGRGSNQ